MNYKYYIYPNYNPHKDPSSNKYLKFFNDSFIANELKIGNKNGQLGIVSILFNLDSDIFILNWVDLIPFKKFGRIQFFIFILSVILLNLLNKKIIWVLHNKKSHLGESWFVDFGMNFIAKYSDKVLVHSSEGVDFYNKKFAFRYGYKAYHIPHPVYSSEIVAHKTVKWDYIIWGRISPYKRIYEFLCFANQSDYFKDKKILICGSCSDGEYLDRIKSQLNSNIYFINKFIQEDELKYYIQKSRCILFTYNPSTLLSSGALIHSLNYNRRIIGPNVGNFTDLKGIVDCYEKFEDIPDINIHTPINSFGISEYIINNTWVKVPLKIQEIIYTKKNENSIC